jgi:hypothetical protein
MRSDRQSLNLFRAVPDGGLLARALPGSPTVGEMFAHMQHERMVSLFENAPEWAGVVPERELSPEPDPHRIEEILLKSGERVRDAVKSRIEADRGLDSDFAHPIQLLQFLISHEGYHHGQIKPALKAAGCPRRAGRNAGLWMQAPQAFASFSKDDKPRLTPCLQSEAATTGSAVN